MRSVSVLMATYNGERHIEAQLRSISGQTLPPHEVWIADDGSSDETLRIISRFAQEVGFPVRIRVNTQGVGRAENFLGAAQLCTGDFIAFCDQDGEWQPEKLELCVAALESEQAVLCVHTALALDQRSDYVGFLDQGIRSSRTVQPFALSPWTSFIGATLVFRRELFTLIEPDRRGRDSADFDRRLSHEDWIFFLAHSLGAIVTLAHPLGACRQADGRIFHAAAEGLGAWLGLGRQPAPPALSARHEISLYRAHLMADLAERRPTHELAGLAREAAGYWRWVAEICAQAERHEALPAAVRPGLLGQIARWMAQVRRPAPPAAAKPVPPELLLAKVRRPRADAATPAED